MKYDSFLEEYRSIAGTAVSYVKAYIAYRNELRNLRAGLENDYEYTVVHMHEDGIEVTAIYQGHYDDTIEEHSVPIEVMDMDDKDFHNHALQRASRIVNEQKEKGQKKAEQRKQDDIRQARRTLEKYGEQ